MTWHVWRYPGSWTFKCSIRLLLVLNFFGHWKQNISLKGSNPNLIARKISSFRIFMPSYNMLPYVGLCGGGVRTVGTRVGLRQLAVGVDMVIQMAPARYFSWSSWKQTLSWNTLGPHDSPSFENLSTAWICAAELSSFIPVGLDVILKTINWHRSGLDVQSSLPDSQSRVCPENWCHTLCKASSCHCC